MLTADQVQIFSGRWQQTVTATAASAVDQVQLSPGRWQLADRALSVTENGRETLVPSTEVHDYQRYFRCVGPDGAVDSILPYGLKGGRDCSATGTVANGRIALTGRCEDSPAGPISFSLDGTYSRQDIHIIQRIHMGDSQHRVIVTYAADGRSVGPCKGDEEK